MNADDALLGNWIIYRVLRSCGLVVGIYMRSLLLRPQNSDLRKIQTHQVYRKLRPIILFVRDKKVEQEAITECATDVLTKFCRLLWFVTEHTRRKMESICFILQNRQIIPNFVYFSRKRVERCFAHFWQTRKITIWRIYRPYKLKRYSLVGMWSQEFWLFQRNTQLSNFNWARVVEEQITLNNRTTVFLSDR